MNTRRTWLIVLLLIAPAASAREAAFKTKPSATQAGDKVKIAFAVSVPTDVEVAVVNAEGEVVRSLAAGVLGGPNAPPEPLKPGLAQEITWDGLGDWKLPVGPGPFKIRVRAGMGVKFGRTIADSPYNFNETVCRGLAVDPKSGDLYVLAKKTRDGALYFLRVYDRKGNYLREIMPYPASIDAKSREAFGSVAVPGAESRAPMNYHSLWPTFYPINAKGQDVNDVAYKLVAVHPTEDAVLLVSELFTSLYRIRKSDGAAVASTFAEPLWGPGTKVPYYDRVGPVMGAIAPDGKSVYFTGYCGAPAKGQKRNAAWPEGRVYRTQADEGGLQTKPFADVAVSQDAPPPERGWNVMADFQNVHAVTVDKKGRVFVCDSAGGKVWIFAADGKPAGAVAVADPYVAAVDDKAGALYVLTRRRTSHGVYRKSLVKLDGCDEKAKIVDTLAFPERGGASDPFLAGDFCGPSPQLWVSGCAREESVLRIEDHGGKLAIVEDLADRDKAASGFACRMDVDPEADLVYVHNGWGYTYRYNGLTGEYAGAVGKDGRPKPIIGSEFCVRRDGMIYVSGGDYAGGGYSGPWSRLNRDLTPAASPGGKPQFSDRYGKMGGGYFGNQGSCVTPDGHLYFNGMFIFRINAIFEVNPDGTPGRCLRLRDAFANSQTTEKRSEKISAAVAKAGFEGALVGWLQDQSGGVEVDQQGCVYAGIRILPRDYTLPEGLAEAAKKYRHFADSLGSVVKFRPSGGGMVPDSLQPGEKYRIDKAWTYEFTVPDKLQDGVKMAPGQRLDWYKPPRTIHMEGGVRAYAVMAPFSNQCACQTPRFEVDDYGRLYIPNALTCSVQVVDNEGNEILRFGAYGNSDSQGPGSKAAKPTVPLAYPVAAKASWKHIYVADSANRRVVRVDPVWAAEETCEVK
jgi:hypothetical protein